MSYDPHWTHQNIAGHVASDRWIAAQDTNELESAINRRLRLLFNPATSWPAEFAVQTGMFVSAAPLVAARGHFDDMIPAWSFFAHNSGWGQLSSYSQWVCPQTSETENAVIVPDARPPDEGEVGFFARLNGCAGWADAVSPGDRVSADHINELRDAAAMLSRGRITLRVGDGGSAAASRDLPDGLWNPPAVCRDGADEMHCWFGGRLWLWADDGEGGHFGTRGQSVAVRSATFRLRPLGRDLLVKLYHCKRNVDPDHLSWTHYDAGNAWQTPGGAGGNDAALIASLALTDGQWTEHATAATATLLQQLADGDAEPTFMLAPDQQTGWPDEPTHIDIQVIVDFDLDCPPA